MIDHNSVIRRVARNVAMLASSSGIAGLCAVVSLAFNTRALGAHDFGALSLIQAYVALIAGLTSFESWQPIVRLGVRLPHRLGTALASGVMLDLVAACAATIIALGGLALFGTKFGISEDFQGLAAIYSLSLLAGLAGTPKGYFRLSRSFKILATNQASLAVAMMLGSIVLYFFEARLSAYVIVYAILAASYNLLLFMQMLLAVRGRAIPLKSPFRSRPGKRLLKLVLKMSVGSSVLASLSSSRRHVALFAVGHLLGESAAGIYAVAAKLVTAVSRFALLLNQIIFPEVIKGAASLSPSALASALRKASIGGIGVSALITATGSLFSVDIIIAVSGQAFSAAAPAFALLLGAECLGLAGIHFNPVIQNKFGPRPLINYAAVSLMAFLAAVAVFNASININGVAMAVMVSSLLTYALTARKVRAYVRSIARS